MPLGGVPRSGDCGEASEPIGDHTEQLSLQIQELLKLRDQLKGCDGDTAAAKKKKKDKTPPKVALDPEVAKEYNTILAQVSRLVLEHRGQQNIETKGT